MLLREGYLLFPTTLALYASAMSNLLAMLKIAHLHCTKRSAVQVSGKKHERPRNDGY